MNKHLYYTELYKNGNKSFTTNIMKNLTYSKEINNKEELIKKLKKYKFFGAGFFILWLCFLILYNINK